MNQVLAAGVILFRFRGSSSKEYLLLQKRNEKWAPAKGRLEKDETDYEAAVRECLEETGLIESQDYELVNKTYTITNLYKTSNNRNKRVVYWLAQVKDYNVEIKLSNEHQAFKWMSYETIIDLLHKSEMCSAIIEANEFLKSKSSE